MKRSLTGIAAAAVVLGAMSPMAFAATSKATGLTKASQLPIVVNGKVLSNPYEMTGKDSGNTTGFFPIYYFNQALAKIGFTATWDGTTHTWAITAPGVTPTVGTVGTGNTTVTVNGTVVRKFNTQVAKDPAGGAKAQATTYLPIYYVQSVLSALGVQGSFSGQTGLSITSAQNNTGSLSTIAVSGATSGDGSTSNPAVSLNNGAVSLSTTLTDANGNPVANTAVIFNFTEYGNLISGEPLPTVENASGAVVSGTAASNAEQYTVYTDSTGVAKISVSTPSSTQGAAYEVVATAPYSSTSGAVSSAPAYIQFVASNEAGLSPYGTSGNEFKASLGTAVPVTVTLPENAQGQPQANVLVTLSITGGTAESGATFTNASGANLGSTVDVTTNSAGVATALLSSSVKGDVEITVSGLPTGVNAPSPTWIDFGQAGVPSKIGNVSVSDLTPNLGDDVVVSGQLQDASGNPVANGQILVTSPNVNTLGGVDDTGHLAYVTGSGSSATTTTFPMISAVTTGTPATSAYGDVVTADANGNFSFTLTDPRNEEVAYNIYGVANGEVADGSTTLNTGDASQPLTFGTSSTVSYLSVGAFDNYVESNSDTSVNGLTAIENGGGTAINNIGDDNGKNPQIADVYVEPQNSAGHHTGGALDAYSETYTLSVDNGGMIYSINGMKLSDLGLSPAAGVTVQYTPASGGNAAYFTVNGSSTHVPALSVPHVSDFEIGVINANSGDTKLTIQNGSVSSTATITFSGGSPEQIANLTPGSSVISAGGSQTVTFQAQDVNGNPVTEGTAVKIYTSQDADDPFFVTQVNGSSLQESLNLQSGAGNQDYTTVNTPIPLGALTGGLPVGAASGSAPLNYSVSIPGVAQWTNNSNYFTAYTDANGDISLTLQAGGLSYPTQYDSVNSINGNAQTTIPAGSGTIFFYTDTNGTPATDGGSNGESVVISTGDAPSNAWSEVGTINAQ